MTGKPIFGQLLKVANSAAARFHEAIGKGAVEIPGLREPGVDVVSAPEAPFFRSQNAPKKRM